MQGGDEITVQATSTFWLESARRFVHPPEQVTIPRTDYPMYEAVCRHLVAGTLEDRKAPPRKSFRDKVVEKGAALVAAVASSGEKFDCPHCTQVFKAAKGLEIHLKNAHKDKE